MSIVFKETDIFTGKIIKLLNDDEYKDLQNELLVRPDAGPVIPKSGGVRKLRWALEGGGKRGGCRIIYYWATKERIIFMLYAYAKSSQEDLTSDQLKKLKAQVIEEFQDG